MPGPGGHKRPAQAKEKVRDMDNRETTVMAKPPGHADSQESSFWTHPPASLDFGHSRRTRISPQQLNSWQRPGASFQNPYRPSFGPPLQEEPELTELLKSHTTALPQAVQDVVTKLTQPIPGTESDCSEAQDPGHRVEVSLNSENPAADQA